jgi:type IV secretory pathway TrbD component
MIHNIFYISNTFQLHCQYLKNLLKYVYLNDKREIIRSNIMTGIPAPGAVLVRTEEALIVILVLLLWAAAIALFFNRWGKIRMLEPYQPKFQQQHRQSCTTIEQNQFQVMYISYPFKRIVGLD